MVQELRRAVDERPFLLHIVIMVVIKTIVDIENPIISNNIVIVVASSAFTINIMNE